MAVPNMYSVVVETANEYPREFREAHTDSQNKWLWIKLLAYKLNQLDPRWGLNGKRGNPNDLSMDAINWKGEGVGFDPTRNDSPITVIDVIGGAGGPDPRPAWQVFNDPNVDRGPGAWVQPQPVGGYSPNPNPNPTPAPPEPPPVTNLDLVNAVTKVELKLSAVLEALERQIQGVDRAASVTQDLANKLDQHEIETKLDENKLAIESATNATNALAARLDRGFRIGAKAGWPVGNISGDVVLKD